MVTIKKVAGTDPASLTPVEIETLDHWVAFCREFYPDDKMVTCREVPQCGLFLRGKAAADHGTDDFPCLAVLGPDELGNWTVLKRTGAVPLIMQFLGDEVF